MWGKCKNFIKDNRTLYSFILPFYRLIKKNKNAAFFDQLFSSVVGGSIKLTVKNIPGEYEIDARSDILKRIMLSKEYEPEIVRHVLKNIDKEKDAINIGANIGLFTNLLADNLSNNCKVLAIEPTPNAYKLLITNIKWNKNSDKVITFNGIATDKAGIHKINVINGKEEYSSVGMLVHPAIMNEEYTCIEVKGETVDYLVKTYNLKPGLLVIDVEGAEYSVLKGSVNTLRKYKPIIISEIDDFLIKQSSSTSKEIINLLKNMGYQIESIDGLEIKYPFTGNVLAFPVGT